jgi:hypothetical protein
VRRLLLFAAVLAVLGVRHLSWISDQTAEWINLAAPFAVVAAAAAVLAQLEARGVPLAVAVVGGILYVDGHGMHLAADSIRSEGLSGEAERVAHFWDERLSHWELHSGLILVVVAFCLAEAQTRVPVAPVLWAAVSTAALLGLTLFAGVVEGGTWWLLPPAAVALGVWALRRPRPVLRTCAAAFGLGLVLLVVWVAWHGGVPQFSDLGWI